jgi:predicted nuclease of predicted toxin-antitoxin system
MMAFKVDENLPVELADLLRQAGYDAVTVFKQHLEGSTDSDIASVCQEERRVLVTLDTDFADIRAYPPAQFPGLIVLRLHRQDKPHVLEVLERLIPLLSSEPLEHLLWIVEETRVRIRG